MTMQERRRFKRDVLALYLPIFNVDNGHILGYLGDISDNGLLLIGEEAIELRQILNLSIKLESAQQDIHHDDGSVIHIECRAESRWSARPDKDLYSTGFMFKHIAPEALSGIHLMLNKLTNYQFVETLFNLDESLSLHQLEILGEKILVTEHVLAVTFEEHVPHLMIVKYDQQKITATAIQQVLLAQDVQANIIQINS